MRRSSSASAQSMARSRAIFARSNRIRMRARFCRSASGTWVRTLRSSTCTAWGGPYTVPERRRQTNACSRPTSQSSNLHAQICRLSGGRLMRGVSVTDAYMKLLGAIVLLILSPLGVGTAYADSDGYYCVGRGYLAYQFGLA